MLGIEGGKKRKEFQSWRRNSPWEKSQTEQTALVVMEQDWFFFFMGNPRCGIQKGKYLAVNIQPLSLENN